MSNPTTRFEYDKTGVNPDNLVIGEIHTLSTNQIRACAPIYGAFFTESLQVYDHTTDRLLQYGTQYKVVEMLQDATMRIGKEICLLILIIDRNVGNQVRINYQALGGMYQNDASAIVSMYETIAKDNRSVDWINVLNKPLEYPPALHLHLLEDIYGFQPLVDAIERVRTAIILSDVPAFEGLADWVKLQLDGLSGTVNILSNALNALNTALQAEILQRSQKDIDLQNEIDNTISVKLAELERQMNNELAPIVSGLTAIDSRIIAEAQARATADTGEADARITGDQNLQSQINNLSNTLSTSFLPLAGGTMTGPILMNTSSSVSPAMLQKGGAQGGVHYYDSINPVSGIYNYKLSMGDSYFRLATNTINTEEGMKRSVDAGDTVVMTLNCVSGDLTATGNVSAYSDPRLKNFHGKIESALTLCNKISGYRFSWNGASSLTKLKEGKEDIGLNADEVQNILPEIVGLSEKDADGNQYKTVSYEKLVPVLLEAIKELNERVRVLESQKTKAY